jgi:hypothetical protein
VRMSLIAVVLTATFMPTPTSADTIGLVSRNSREVACYSTQFNGYLAKYKDGKFHIFRAMQQCMGDRNIPKQCDFFTHPLPKAAIPDVVRRAVGNNYLYHEFWTEDVNVIEFNNKYGDPCPVRKIHPERKKRLPSPALSIWQPEQLPESFPKKIEDAGYIASLERAGVRGTPLPNYRIDVAAIRSDIHNDAITPGRSIPVISLHNTLDTKLNGQLAYIEMNEWSPDTVEYKTYFLEGRMQVDAVKKMAALEVHKIWQVNEAVEFLGIRPTISEPTGLLLDIKLQNDETLALPWELAVRGTKRFLPAEILGIRLEQDRRIMQIRATLKTSKQFPPGTQVIKIIRRSVH